MKKTVLFQVLCCFFLLSCNKLDFGGMIIGQKTDVNDRFDSSMKYLETHPLNDIYVNSNDYNVYLITDIHFESANSSKFERFVSSCISDSESEKIVLCLGDNIDKKGNQQALYDKLQTLTSAGWKFFTTPGNHDIFFHEWENYRNYFPICSYSFKINTPSAGSDLFIYLDSAEGSIGTSQRTWLETLLKKEQGKNRNITVLTHTNFYNTDNTQFTSGNFKFEETFDLMSLFANYEVNYVLTGHDHYYEHCTFRGVEYYTFNAFCNESCSHYILNYSSDLRFTELVQNGE